MKHKIGAVIVAYNSENELEACIKSVQQQSGSIFNTVAIVVNNKSNDDSLRVAKRAKAIVINNGKNLGFSKAVNIGVKAAYDKGCDYILILNPDAVLLSGSLENMFNTLVNADNVAAVGPLMVHNDRTPANEGYYLKAPSILSVTCFSTLLRPWSLKRDFLTRRYEEQNLIAERAVEQIPGACLLTSRKLLDKIGLLDEDFAIWFEDVEWSYRARKKGYELLFCPGANVIHEGGVSFSKWEGLEKSVTFYVSMKTFFRKHKPLSYPWIILVLCANAFASYLKGRDRNQLLFIKRFVKQKKGTLPT